MDPTTLAPAANGDTSGVHDSKVEGILLGEPLTQGYRPSLPLWAMGTYGSDIFPQLYLLRDIELMMIHPVVRSALNAFKAGIAGAEFEVTVKDTSLFAAEVQEFVTDQCKRFWDRGVPLVQGGYEYGWIGCENLYSNDSGRLEWEGLLQFSPRDVYLLTQDNRPVGVRVKQIREAPRPDEPAQPMPSSSESGVEVRGRGMTDLWLAEGDVPAKALWYAHNPRYSQFYGQSQLLGAWRPWRRLAWKDGAETNIDGGFYRFFYAGPIVRYPEEDLQGPAGSPATSTDSQGRSRRYARDMARMIAEWYKSGAGVGLPSTQYPADLGGGDKWGLELPKSTLNIDGGVNYVKHLWTQIRYGVGVPPELADQDEGGGGAAAASIPLEGFMMQQQYLADAILLLFVVQVLRPLVRWNWGDVKFEVKVKNLLQTKRLAQTGQPGDLPPGQVPGGANSAPTGGWKGGPTPGIGTRSSGMTPTPVEAPPNEVQGMPFSLDDHLLGVVRQILGEAA